MYKHRLSNFRKIAAGNFAKALFPASYTMSLTFPLIIIGSLVALFWLADLAYALRTQYRRQRWERQTQRGADGVRNGAEAFTAGNGSIALLLIHGYADSPAQFRFLVPLLVEQGFACHAMRLPGLVRDSRPASAFQPGF